MAAFTPRPALPFARAGFAALISDGALLTTANLVAAAGNYFFQAIMRRHLSWSEFGYLNTTLSVIIFAGIPLTAASQTLAHHVAQFHAHNHRDKIQRLEAASLKYLGRLTWIMLGLSLLLFFPLSKFLHFPRLSLACVAALWIPVNVWSTLGGAWCIGLGRFRFLSLLVMMTAAVRLTSGALGVAFYPSAETGVMASLVAGVVLATVVPLRASSTGENASMRLHGLVDRDLVLYGLAALAVAFAAFIFLQGDQMISQRQFPGELLGRFSGAGLLGRTVVWGSLPILTVYFARRSGHNSESHSPVRLLAIYGGLILVGAFLVSLLRNQLLSLLLGTHDPVLAAMTACFALAMVPVGAVQALGYHCLAARYLPECFALGACAAAYLIALAWLGHTPAEMLAVIGLGATCATLLVGGMLILRSVKRSVGI